MRRGGRAPSPRVRGEVSGASVRGVSRADRAYDACPYFGSSQNALARSS